MNHRYEFWWQGQLDPAQVFLQHRQQNPIPLSPADQMQIQRVCRQHRDRGQRVENLPLYQYLHFHIDPNGLHLEVARTTYEDYLGLGVLNHAQAPLVLAVCAATEIEGQLVIERRSALVAQGRGLLHVKPSGHIHPPASPWQALECEALEELALQPHEIDQASLLGLVCSHTANCVSLVYRLHTPLDWKTWRKRTPIDSWEAEELFGLPSDQESLRGWLDASAESSAGPGHAAVLCFYEWRYGPTRAS
ncbi:hypothetical protein IV102_31735 [bacterium]|nr:hypothetical protein [bacterium]